MAVELVGREDAHRAHQPQRDRQVVMAALLVEIGRREIDRDPLDRKGEPDRGERGPHPLAALGDRLVGQADEEEGADATPKMDLNIDIDDVDAEERDGADARVHG